MKLKLFYLSFLFSVLFLNFSNSQQTYLPDDVFEQYLIDEGYDTVLDNYVLTANIANIDTVNLYDKNVTDLTGIEDFAALTNLNISSTLVLNIDVSANTALTTLNIYDTSISSLDVSNNSALINLYADNTLLNSLDVSANTALTTLFITNTEINSLDVSNNTSLEVLGVSDTPIISLDLSNNTSLTYLSIYNTLISSLDVSNNSVLTTLKTTSTDNLYCITVADEAAANAGTGIYLQWEKDEACNYSESCNFTYVPDNVFEQYLIDQGYDVAPIDNYVPTANIKHVNSVDLNNTGVADLTGIEDFVELTVLDVSFTSVTNVNVSNNIALTDLFVNNTLISDLNVSLNTNLNILNALNTPNLDCITVANEADATSVSGIYVNWQKDAICSYRENCSAPLSDIEFDATKVFVGPNPIKDQLQIKLNNADVLNDVSVYNISGKLILKSTSTNIATSHLVSGMYLVRITTDKGSFTRKLIK
ncbi:MULTISPECIES: T9SS type A sorting domain-containing protein [Winogradskyella]|uniref:T9SS type A sorting domain-containing protein n=1 Tax=Winogradskyella TaxID=286104 RepID=UPI002FEFEA76